jgi:hypothetical protein
MLAGHKNASAISTVNVSATAVVGVPEMMPVFESRVRPAGSCPAEIVKVYGAVPPVADMVALYAILTVPEGSTAGVTLIGLQPPSTTMVNC